MNRKVAQLDVGGSRKPLLCEGCSCFTTTTAVICQRWTLPVSDPIRAARTKTRGTEKSSWQRLEPEQWRPYCRCASIFSRKRLLDFWEGVEHSTNVVCSMMLLEVVDDEFRVQEHVPGFANGTTYEASLGLIFVVLQDFGIADAVCDE
jgi:hypothetical protein